MNRSFVTVPHQVEILASVYFIGGPWGGRKAEIGAGLSSFRVPVGDGPEHVEYVIRQLAAWGHPAAFIAHLPNEDPVPALLKTYAKYYAQAPA